MANQSMLEGVQISTNAGVARIHFAHAKQNAFPATHLKDLKEAFEKVSKDKSVQVIVLQSEPSMAFCAGASFDELLAVNTPEEGKVFFMGFANVINAMRRCPQPIIARVHGKAVGGGVGLISACDYALALPTAEVKLSEIAIGIGPFVIAPVVQRKIGTAALSELSLSSHSWKSVDWAKQKGLFAEILPTIDQLDKAVDQHAKRLASYAPEAVAALKKELWHNTDDWDHRLSSNAEITGRLLLSKQTQQTIQNIKNNQ